ncbi:hypothetical protein DFQ01_13012 [Paenibacillus cellulosilyticus]|uniref:Uncharacterized protein n=1 Tax=Paenibacillus cellulosilyticus TaxID=375489 RepID=A0A2V2YP12_9BACL|nr:hypothetical protein DFQ01_13012 [Paenibacillus cellulosilyticus]
MKYLYYCTFIAFMLFFMGINMIGDNNKIQNIAQFCIVVLGVGGSLYLFDKYIYSKIKRRLSTTKKGWNKLLVIELLFIFVSAIIPFLLIHRNNPEQFYEKLIIFSCLFIWSGSLQIGRNMKERREQLKVSLDERVKSHGST